MQSEEQGELTEGRGFGGVRHVTWQASAGATRRQARLGPNPGRACASCPEDQQHPLHHHATVNKLGIMEDTTMMEASQPLFDGATFIIIPTTLTQDRVIEVRWTWFRDPGAQADTSTDL
jgi:hypothetical protein